MRGKMTIEKLSNNNVSSFKQLLKESQSDLLFKFDFYSYYNERSFLVKYFIRKNVKLILVNGEYVGYIWFDFKSLKTLTINDLYIRKEYFYYLNSYILKSFNSDYILFETYETSYMIELLKILNMKRIRISQIMEYKDNNLLNEKNQEDVSFAEYAKNKDAKIRCEIQNNIFENENRAPLSIDDIYYDEKQDYFLDNMSLFMKLKEKYIGYGQIIYTRGLYMIVNFGVIKEFRSKGYGRVFLNALIKHFKEKINSNIFIRVDSNNKIARKLYEKSGFMDKGIISTWLYENKK
ncbi:MAG: GNAT family N-acetyltransferase [Clostridium sp.]|nr:GNAT family N-acetyltransferase [Clostridium sp.]